MSPEHLLVAVLLFAVMIGAVLAGRATSASTWLPRVAPLLSFVLIAVLRDASGGSSSGLAPLVALPVIWVALYGRGWDLAWVATATVLTFALPLLLIGAPSYDAGDWRRAVVWFGVVALVAPVIQRVVHTLELQTRRERAAHADLAEVEESWRILMDNLTELTVFVVDRDHRIEVVTGAGAMAQQVTAEVSGRTIADISSPENAAILDRLIEGAFAGESGSADLVATRTGAEHHVVVSPLPSREGGGHALVLARDVSRDRAHERALTRAKQRSEQLFEDSPNGIVLTDDAGIILRANTALAATFGVDPETLVGTRLADLSSTGTDHDLTDHFREVAAAPAGRGDAEWVGRRHDGATIHLALSSAAVDGDEGELTGAEATPRLVLSNVVDVSERIRHNQQLSHMADHDSLTGLVNRRRFEVVMTEHLDKCAHYGAEGALLLLDLDNFKEVNDTLGHGVGDQLITSVARLLEEGLRSTDLVARLGGDEFAVLLPTADAGAARFVAQDILERIRAYSQAQEGVRRRVTASIGVVLIGDRHTTLEDLLATADMTMYDAKESGRDQYVVLGHHENAQPRMGARLEWSQRIQQAIEHDEFVLQLQPILDVRTGRIASAEALIRLRDGDQLLMPDRFLYIAERTGEIIDIDRWVIDHAVEILSRIQQAHPDFQLEVNLSGKSIGTPLLDTALTQALLRHGADPTGLVLEITETAAVAHMQTALSFAERQRRLGCKFALDDFGAGFGSFYYLKHLPIDYVKIDGEFVAGCHTNPVDRSIVGSIVGIARGLGKQTIAEHVSSAEILEVIKEEGVDLAQGFHIAESVSFEALMEVLGSQAGAGRQGRTRAAESPAV